MKKTNEIIKMWKDECNKPLNVVFNIQIDRKDFDEMVKEIEGLQEKNEKLQQKLDAKIMFVSNGNEEEMYALQERAIELETVCKDAIKIAEQLSKENDQLKKDKALFAKVISLDMKKRI